MSNYPDRNLTDVRIKDGYTNLLQNRNGVITDGLGNSVDNVSTTASWAANSITSSYAFTQSYIQNLTAVATISLSSSWASQSLSASWAINSQTSSYSDTLHILGNLTADSDIVISGSFRGVGGGSSIFIDHVVATGQILLGNSASQILGNDDGTLTLGNPTTVSLMFGTSSWATQAKNTQTALTSSYSDLLNIGPSNIIRLNGDHLQIYNSILDSVIIETSDNGRLILPAIDGNAIVVSSPTLELVSTGHWDPATDTISGNISASNALSARSASNSLTASSYANRDWIILGTNNQLLIKNVQDNGQVSIDTTGMASFPGGITANVVGSLLGTASYALNAKSSSATITTGSLIPITSSYSLTASVGGTQLATGSTVPITSSVSLIAVSGGTQLLTGSTVPITSSIALIAAAGGTQLLTGSTVPITSSRALVAITAPNYLLKSGDSVQGNLQFSSGAGTIFGTGGIITFQGGAIVDQVIIQLSDENILSITNPSGSVFFSGSNVSASNFLGTASMATTSSFSLNGGTSLFTASTYQITASKAITSSYAIFAQSGGTQLSTGSTVPITTSISLISISGGTQLATGSTVPITASVAISGGTQLSTGSTVPITSSIALIAISGGTQLITGSLVPITSSYALTQSFIQNIISTSSSSISSSWASQSLSASWAPGSIAGTTLFTSSTYPITSSWAVNSRTASSAPNYLLLAGGTLTGQTTFQQTLNIGAGARIDYQTGASWIDEASSFTGQGSNVGLYQFSGPSGSIYLSGSNLGSIISASLFIGTASYATHGGDGGTLSTGSTVPITSSWAVNVINGGGSNLITGSTIPITSSISLIAIAGGTQLLTGSIVPITASVAIAGGTQLLTGSTVPITSSVSINSINAITAINGGTQLSTGSTVPITSSISLTAIAGGTQLLTGSTVPITSSISLIAIAGGTQLLTGSTVPITSSISLISINSNASTTAVSAISSTSASYSSFAQVFPAVLSTGSTYQITSSWAQTSSLVNVLFTQSNQNMFIPYVVSTGSQQLYVDSNTMYYNPGTDTLQVNNITSSKITSSLFGTSSWSSQSTFAPVIFTGVQVINGQLLILSDLGTGSWYALTVHDDGSGSYSTQLSPTINTGSIYASGSVFVLTSSLQITSSISASWASSSYTSSYLYPNIVYSTTTSNAQTSSNGSRVWAYLQQSSTFTSTSYNLQNIKRLSAGSYGISFNNALNNSFYSVNYTGVSGSSTNLTCSIGYPSNMTVNNFTMSTFLATSPLIPADFTSASISINCI